MTEKRTENDRLSDPTLVDAPVAAEPDLLAFAPNKFSRIEFSPELRKEISGTKLERLDPAVLRDTVPPHRAFPAAPAAPREPAASRASSLPAPKKPTVASTPISVPSPKTPRMATPAIPVGPRAPKDNFAPLNASQASNVEPRVQEAVAELNATQPYKVEPRVYEEATDATNATQTFSTPPQVISEPAPDLSDREVPTIRTRAERRRRQLNVSVGAGAAALFLLAGVLVAVFGHKQPVPNPPVVNEPPPLAVDESPAIPAPVVSSTKHDVSATALPVATEQPSGSSVSVTSNAPASRGRPVTSPQRRVEAPRVPAAPPQVPSPKPVSKSPPPQKTNEPDFEQPFNPQ